LVVGVDSQHAEIGGLTALLELDASEQATRSVSVNQHDVLRLRCEELVDGESIGALTTEQVGLSGPPASAAIAAVG
jgi:hypothetical protein